MVLAMILSSLGCSLSWSAEPDWSLTASIPPGGRSNPYLLSEADRDRAVEAGRLHAQIYPVDVTGLLPPYEPVRRFIEESPADPLRLILQSLFQRFARVDSMNDLFSWIGLQPYPRPEDQGVYAVPYPGGRRPDTLMGLGLVERDGATGFTLSCAACHAGNLFGKTVLGMSTRFPRANETFRRSAWAAHYYRSSAFSSLFRATPAEVALLDEAVRNLASVGVKRPLTLGLDTSLAQVALSLNKRNEDAMAGKNPRWQARPRADLLDSRPADSKPAVWWNLKYKNRWLSDGSVISGNPIFTNLLWNEIGRGADLDRINHWLSRNDDVIRELTTAVFSAEAPRWTDFFPAEQLDLPLAKEGQGVYRLTCARCHGVYEKAWDQPAFDQAPLAERLRTTQVIYHRQTPVIDVGTDPFRHEGMKSLERLNQLEISRRHGTVIQAQKGYVPPPLVGIWARWPYFHHNSAPSLCAVLTRSSERPVSYYAGEARDRRRDFDAECNGYPQGDKVPAAWRKKEFLYDTRRAGMGRDGHDEGIFLERGRELLSARQKRALVEFLKTL
ncbi:MAG: hypothetical protein KF865_09960 [Bdellovibrionaceae bacterium]|nr:hypothetical protein [Pseudobdellovibrionaceae bacterium]